MALSLNQFAQALTAAELMSADEVKAFFDAVAAGERPKEAEGFAKLLVKAGKLTAFQAQHLLAGRAAALTVGEYLLVDRIGAGGMGQVFKATHRRMNRIVALKMMSPQAMKDEAAVKRFQREVRAAARLEHQNIVTAYDAGQHGKTHFLVMQYVEGGDLAGLVKAKGPLPIDRAVDFTLQAARGLAFAHAEGIVHRDIKPANLLIDKKGTVKILDMGLARVVEQNDELTGTEQVMGTVDYMSPEQASDAKNADARSDIYSLGCTLWFLLTNGKLYDGDTLIARLVKHRDAPLPSLLQVRDDAPWSLEQTLHKMVAKRADERFQSMDEVVASLDQVHAAAGGGMGSSVLADADLASFLSGIGGSGGASRIGGASQIGPGSSGILSGVGEPGSQSGSRSGLTVPLGVSTGDTDGMTATVGPRSSTRMARGKPIAAAKPKQNKALLIGGGVAAALLIVGGLVWALTRSGGDAAIADNAAGAARTGPAPKPLKAPFDAATARKAQQAWSSYLGIPVVSENSIGMKFVLIPPGEYLMGSTPAEIAQTMAESPLGPDNDVNIDLQGEGPQHRVVITKPFLIGQTEVTVGQFAKFVEATKYETIWQSWHPNDPKNWRSGEVGGAADDTPVTFVDWHDAAAFCNWLSAQEKLPPAYMSSPTIGWIPMNDPLGYRLPTDAQWEYACRAGTTTRFHYGDDPALLAEYGWFGLNSGGKVQPVGKLKPNAFGLFDMHGNVYEWCLDAFAADFYGRSPTNDPENIGTIGEGIYRGGHVHQPDPVFVRSAFRRNTKNQQFNHSGIRLSRIIDPAKFVGEVRPAVGVATQAAASPKASNISFGAPSASGRPVDFAAERRAADWALGKGGGVYAANAADTVVEFRNRPSLPPGEWRVRGIDLHDRNNVRDDELRLLEPLAELEMLDLGRSGIKAAAFPYVGSLPTLTSVDLSRSGATDRDVDALTGLKRLQRLVLYETQVSEDGIEKLIGCPLRELELGSVTAGNALIAVLRDFPNIESVRLDQVFISDSSVAGLAQLPNLKTLELRDARITDKGLDVIAALPGLRELVLGGLSVTPLGLERLRTMPGLERLDLRKMQHLSDAAVELQNARPELDVRMDGARLLALPFPMPPEPAPAVSHNTLSEAERSAGWRLLFDGHSFTGWRRSDGNPNPIGWWVVDGQIRSDGGAGFLSTTEDFEFYDLRFDFRCDPTGNSGVCYHVDGNLNPPSRSGPEFELNPTNSSTGLIWNVGDMNAGAKMADAPHDWYHFRLVTAPRRARHFVYAVDGRLLLDKRYDLDSPEYQNSPLRRNPEFLRQERGRIALQSLNKSAAFRNLKLLQLAPDAAMKLATE